MSGRPAVHVRDLHKRYGPVQALKGVSLEVPRGSIFGLLGPNGAGKTTFIRILIGSSKCDSGQVSVIDLDPEIEKWELRRKIGYMPQEPSLYEDLSARENMTFFANAHRRKDLAQRVEQTLEFVGLSGRAHDPLYKLSGGMKQRVSLACALVHQSQMLLLDEPTTGIDPKLRESFWQHFRQLADSGCTLLVSTHQMDEVPYCDQIAILQAGELLAVDTPRRLLWTGSATVRIEYDGQTEVIEVQDYPHRLPQHLRAYGLDPAVVRIEVEEPTLEKVVLDMIARHERRTLEES